MLHAMSMPNLANNYSDILNGVWMKMQMDVFQVKEVRNEQRI